MCKTCFDVVRRNGKNSKVDSHHAVTMQNSNPGLLHPAASAASAPPLVYDHQTTTSPHSLLYVLHRWYIEDILYGHYCTRRGYFIVGELCAACMRYIMFSQIISLALVSDDFSLVEN